MPDSRTNVRSTFHLQDAPSSYQHLYDEIEQLSLCKYKARVHWGKNMNRAFTNPNCPTKVSEGVQGEGVHWGKDMNRAFTNRKTAPPRRVRARARPFRVVSPCCTCIYYCHCACCLHGADASRSAEDIYPRLTAPRSPSSPPARPPSGQVPPFVR